MGQITQSYLKGGTKYWICEDCGKHTSEQNIIHTKLCCDKVQIEATHDIKIKKI